MKKLEQVIIGCEKCEREVQHLYMGDYGVQWKPIHVYQCNHCKNLYNSLTKLKEVKRDL